MNECTLDVNIQKSISIHIGTKHQRLEVKKNGHALQNKILQATDMMKSHSLKSITTFEEL